MKSVNRTFRLDEDLLKAVHELAQHKNVSMNEFVVEAIRQAVADALVEGLEMEEVPSMFLAKIMEYVPTESAAELGRWSTANFSRKFVWEIFKEISPDTLIKAYEMFANKYKSILSFEHRKQGSEHTLKILHHRGQKWSVFYAEVIRSAFRDLLGIELEIELGPNEVRGKFTESNTYVAKTRQVPQIIE